MKLRIGDYIINRPGENPGGCTWESNRLVNGHLVICGKTGSGKSHTFKKMVKAAGYQRVRIHVFDVHGDLALEDESIEFKATFSAKTLAGFNPLEINTHEHTGGVRSTINHFLSLLDSVDRALQVRQKNILRSLLEDCYQARGILEEKPSSWVKKRLAPGERETLIKTGRRKELRDYYPTLDDLIEFGQTKYNSVFGIGDSEDPDARRAAACIKALKETYKKVTKLRDSISKEKQAGYEIEITNLQKEQDKYRADAKEFFGNFIDMLSTGAEMEDMVNYDHKDSFASILIRLKDLKGSGIFSGNVPRFDPTKPIWNYNLKHLPDAEKKLLIYYAMGKIFDMRRDLGEADGVKEIIVVDEAHKFITNDGENIFNLIAKEARKFGMALWCASQNPRHFSEDFLTAVGTKVLLGVDKSMWDKISRSWDISRDDLAKIIPRQNCAIQMDYSGQKASGFRLVTVGQASLRAVAVG